MCAWGIRHHWLLRAATTGSGGYVVRAARHCRRWIVVAWRTTVMYGVKKQIEKKKSPVNAEDSEMEIPSEKNNPWRKKHTNEDGF